MSALRFDAWASATANTSSFMKPCILLLAALVGLASAHADTILLSDDFSGATLDSSKWTTILPFGGSSVTQSGGTVTTTGRGILATANGYTQPYIINGAFTMLDGLEHFNVAFRTDLTGSSFGEREGMLVSFSNDGDQISIQRYTSAADWNGLAVKSYALITGQTYFFSIFDDGTNIDLAVNGIHELSASSSYSTGDQIAFYSREFGGGTALDAVTITHVPETGMTGLYVLAGIAGLIATTRKMRRVGV